MFWVNNLMVFKKSGLGLKKVTWSWKNRWSWSCNLVVLLHHCTIANECEGNLPHSSFSLITIARIVRVYFSVILDVLKLEY